jgi:tetratricopeptide (TPR) repeat protein
MAIQLWYLRPLLRLAPVLAGAGIAFLLLGFVVWQQVHEQYARAASGFVLLESGSLRAAQADLETSLKHWQRFAFINAASRRQLAAQTYYLLAVTSIRNSAISAASARKEAIEYLRKALLLNPGSELTAVPEFGGYGRDAAQRLADEAFQYKQLLEVLLCTPTDAPDGLDRVLNSPVARRTDQNRN